MTRDDREITKLKCESEYTEGDRREGDEEGDRKGRR